MTRRDVALMALGAILWLAALGAWRFVPGLDVRLLGMVETVRGTGAARIAKVLTRLGEVDVLVGATFVAAAWLLVRGERWPAAWLVAVTLAGRAATAFEKDAFARARPPLVHRLVEERSFSFASAHAFNTMLVGLAIVVALRGSRNAVVAAVSFSLTVGATRLVLGVHWPSDVVAGWGSALSWLMAWRPLLRVRTRMLTAPGD